MYIANNFNDFVEKITEAERTALNTLAGREITQQLLEMKLEENPHLTPEECPLLFGCINRCFRFFRF